MFLTRFLANYIFVSACTVALGSASDSSLGDIGMKTCADGTEEIYSCLRCGETIGPSNFSELVLCPGFNPDHSEHAFHRKCVAEWIVQKRSGKSGETYPPYLGSWEVIHASSWRGVLKEFTLQSIKEEEELQELRRRASRNTLEKSKQVGSEAVDHFKMLEEVYSQFIHVYNHFPHGLASPRDSEVDRVFGNIVEKMLGEMPMEETARALVHAPKFVYTESALNFIRDPIFYAQLDCKQVVDCGKHFFTLAAGGSKFEFFFANIIESRLSTLDSDAVEWLIDLAANPNSGKMQHHFLLALGNNSMNLPLKCRMKLMMLLLRNRETSGVEKLSALQSIGYFREFSNKMRQGAVGYWTQSKKNPEDELFLDILSFRSAKPEGEPQTEVLKYLKEIVENQYKYTEGVMGILELRCYHYMLCSPPSGSFLHKPYKLIRCVRSNCTLSRIILSIPWTGFETRRNLVLISDKLKRNTFVGPALFEAMYFHPGIIFKVALRSLFGCVILAKKRHAYPLETIAHFKVFFREDLEEEVNARLLFGKLKKNGLYALMPLFKEYFHDKTQYNGCIAKNIGRIIERLSGLYLNSRYAPKILYELCDTNNESVFEALCKHLSGYLKIFLEFYGRRFSVFHLLKQIFAKDTFSTHITNEEMEKISSFLLERYVRTVNFKEFMEIFFSEVKDIGTQRRMLRRLRDLKALGRLDGKRKEMLEELFPEEILDK